MVKIAIAGGSGGVARPIIDLLVASKKHEILNLSRQDPMTATTIPGVTWVKADYGDKTQLTSILKGVHTVLSFVDAVIDPEQIVQKNLIDASIAAGVKRFAPSEWSSSTAEEIPWYVGKMKVREYLATINKEKKVLEYCLFQPGCFAEYLVPQETLGRQELWLDLKRRRAICIEGKDAALTLTTINDLANIVARAIEYDGEWPVIGGIHGTTITDTKLLEIGERVRGGEPFDITYLKEEDVRAGDIKSSWTPAFESPALTKEQNVQFSEVILRGCLLSGLAKSWVVSNEWNRLLPDYAFTPLEEFLEEGWTAQA